MNSVNPAAELVAAELPTTRDLRGLSAWAYDVVENTGHDVVLATVHGSYLYGTNHENSDMDFYVVVFEGQNRSLKVGDVDVHVVNMNTWLKNAAEGSHQAIEVLFSPYARLGEKWAPFVRALRPSRYNYLKKSRSASQHVIDRGDPKAHKRAWTFMRQAVAYFEHGDPFYRQHERPLVLRSPNLSDDE